MPDTTEIIVTNLKSAAESSLKFFSDKKEIRSSNNPFNSHRQQDSTTLGNARALMDGSLSSSFEQSAVHGVGNCDEKGRMCYMSLKTNPRITGRNYHVTLCEAIDYDHVFIIVSPNALPGATNISTLGETCMVVDGWTEDWYFPNLSLLSSFKHGVTSIPNPRQLYVREQISRHNLQEYNGTGGTPNL